MNAVNLVVRVNINGKRKNLSPEQAKSLGLSLGRFTFAPGRVGRRNGRLSAPTAAKPGWPCSARSASSAARV